MEYIQAIFSDEPRYPLLFGYSGFFIIPAERLDRFVHYCGVFGALNMFAEVAIPTAMVLACPHISTEYLPGEVYAGCKTPAYNPARMWRGKEWWGEGITRFEDTYKLSLQYLQDHYPEYCLYMHPVKLSRWKE